MLPPLAEWVPNGAVCLLWCEKNNNDSDSNDNDKNSSGIDSMQTMIATTTTIIDYNVGDNEGAVLCCDVGVLH